MKKQKQNLLNVIILLALVSMVMTACGKNVNEQETAVQDVQEEQQVLEQEEEIVEEEQTEPEVVDFEEEVDVTKMSVNEWIKVVNLVEPAFIIYNTGTRERIALEDGQEYQVLEGDMLIEFMPSEYEPVDSYITVPIMKVEANEGYKLAYYGFKDMTNNEEAKGWYVDPNGDEFTISCTFVK